MKVGTLTVQLRLHGVVSLKQKRSLLKHTMHQLRQTYQVAVAEVGQQNSKLGATLGVACVANEVAFVHKVLDRIRKHLEKQKDFDVETVQIEVLA